MNITKETPWVRLWSTTTGTYVDSKYRTYECEASAEEVILAWQRADDIERAEIEASLEFFPYRYGMRRIVQYLIALGSVETGNKVQEGWFREDGDLRPETVAFLVELLREQGPDRGVLVCDTRWFTAYWNGAAYHFETDGKVCGRPSYADYCAEYTKAITRVHRDALARFWGLSRET